MIDETVHNRTDHDHQEDLQRLRDLRPLDDDFMRAMFEDNLPLVEFTLRTITERPDLEITRFRTHADSRRKIDPESVLLAAWGTYDSGKSVMLEIHRETGEIERRRATYHAGALDLENFDPSTQEYNELPDAFMIFIRDSGYPGEEDPVTIIQRYCRETRLPVNDGACILYVNAQYRGDDGLGRLMHDFGCSNPDDMVLDLMAQRARYLKENPEGVEMMCRVMEEKRSQPQN